jgi:hypothetical protein
VRRRLGAPSLRSGSASNPERRQFHYPAIIYGASKAAVSMLTVQYAKALPDIKFNAVEKGAEVIVRMATIGKNGPTDTFQENEDEPAW